MPDGIVGEIAVAGSLLFSRYLNRPEETSAVLDAEGWYYTGDLACKDARGYMVISGRKSRCSRPAGKTFSRGRSKTSWNPTPGWCWRR